MSALPFVDFGKQQIDGKIGYLPLVIGNTGERDRNDDLLLDIIKPDHGNPADFQAVHLFDQDTGDKIAEAKDTVRQIAVPEQIFQIFPIIVTGNIIATDNARLYAAARALCAKPLSPPHGIIELTRFAEIWNTENYFNKLISGK